MILGATPNPTRYAYAAAEMLTQKGHEIVPVGIKNGEVFGENISTDQDQKHEDIDTITLYVGPQNQAGWYDFILKQKPKRLIFNPGTENPELMEMAKKAGVSIEIACTLVMLSVGVY